MPGPGSRACPKPERRAKAKRRKDRAEAAIEAQVRAQVDERDGLCRVWTRLGPAGWRLLGRCAGPGEWAHLGDLRRFKTRGMPPEARHSTAGSCKLCHAHHQGPRGYDGHAFEIEPLTPSGADGPLRFCSNDGQLDESW
jgi:hypothetical protein